jgi:hypothetical protein
MDQFSKNGQPPISASLPIKPDGVRYTMTQEVTWLDDHYFAVGRWDGTLNIFRFNHSSTDGPVITFSINSPSEEGIQMIVWISSTIFITSNNKNSFVLWETHSSTWNEVKGKVINYELSLGVANSGTSVQINNNLYTVIGHESGFISIWDFTNCIEPQFIAKIDLQSTHPVNPWGIHNIRSVNLIEKRSGSAIVLTGSEDGDLCMIEIPSGNIIYRTVYNPAAQRGINSIACINTNEGMSILVANCSVGEQDKNLWHFTLDASGQLTLTDSINLRLNQSDPQVFNFDVVFGRHNNELYFFSTTEEGALWMGKTQGGKITVIGHKMFGQQLGAAIATTNTGKLITAAYDIYEFVTNELQEEIQGENPEWLITVKN